MTGQDSDTYKKMAAMLKGNGVKPEILDTILKQGLYQKDYGKDLPMKKGGQVAHFNFGESKAAPKPEPKQPGITGGRKFR